MQHERLDVRRQPGRLPGISQGRLSGSYGAQCPQSGDGREVCREGKRRSDEGREMTGEECREARERLNWTRFELATATKFPVWFIAARGLARRRRTSSSPTKSICAPPSKRPAMREVGEG